MADRRTTRSEGADETRLAAVLRRLDIIPDDPELNWQAANLLVELGRHGEAPQYLERVITDYPSCGDAWRLLGSALEASGDLDGARRALTRAAELEDDASVEYALADVAARQGDYTAALEHASRALTLPIDPAGASTAHTLRACMHHRLGDDAAELEEYRRAVSADPDSAEAQYRLGYAYWDAGEPEQAIPHFHRAVDLAPGDPDGWHALARAAREVGDLSFARSVLEEFLSRGPGGAELRGELAVVLGRLGDDEGSVREATMALALATAPSLRASLHRTLAAAHKRLGDAQVARDELIAAASLEPEHSLTRFNLGIEYMEQEEFQAAVPHLEAATQLNSGDPAGWYALGYALNRTGAHDAARQALEKALELGHADSGTYAELGRSFARLGDFRTAIEHMERSLGMEDDPPARRYLHTMLAYCYSQLGDHEKAFSHGVQAVREEPENAAAQFTLGSQYLQRGEPAEAIPHLEKAVGLRPEDVGFEVALARCRAELQGTSSKEGPRRSKRRDS